LSAAAARPQAASIATPMAAPRRARYRSSLIILLVLRVNGGIGSGN
jgi:hypothetical protein